MGQNPFFLQMKKYMLEGWDRNLLFLAIIVILTGCGNKIDDTLSDNATEFNTVASTNSNDEENIDAMGAASFEENNDTEDAAEAEDSVSEAQRSPFDIWEYEGYVDECEGYIWQEEFFDCDYDGDGETDRVNRSWDGKEQTAIYTIEFGNGDRLITPKGWETGFPHIQSGDIDGDGTKEVLVTLTYDTSTDPYSFGDMWLFDRNESTGEYNEVELPLANAGENGAKGFEMEYDKPEDGKIRFTIKDAGLSRTEEVGEEYISTWWSDEAVSEKRCVFCAEITNKNNPVLRCYIAPFRRWSLILGFNLNYNNGKYEIGYIEIDEPDSWG